MPDADRTGARTPSASTAGCTRWPRPSSPAVPPGWRIHLRGAGNLPADGAAIICPNHISFLDSFLLPCGAAPPLTFVGKAEYLDSWKTKYLFPAVGMIPIDRSGGEASQQALDAAADASWSGASCSGSTPRAPDRGRQAAQGPHRRGPAQPSRTGAPIIPVGIRRHREIQPPEAKLPAAVQARARSASAGRSSPRRHADRARRPAGAAADDRRRHVRDPGAVRPGVRRRPTPPRSRTRGVPADRRRSSPTSSGTGPAGARNRCGRPPGAAGNLGAPWPSDLVIKLPDGSARRLPAGSTARRPGRGHRLPAARRRRSSPRSTARSETSATALARRRRGRDRHRRRPTRALHHPPLDGPRAGPGRARPVPRAPRSASGRRSRTASTTTSSCPAAGTSRPTTSTASTPACGEIIAEAQPFVRDEIAPIEARELFRDHRYKLEIIDNAVDRPDVGHRVRGGAHATRTRPGSSTCAAARTSSTPAVTSATSS